MILFQASQHRAMISSSDLYTRLDNQLSRMNGHMFSTGLSSGDLGGKGMSVKLCGMASLAPWPTECYPEVRETP